jgi:hypothetical protein
MGWKTLVRFLATTFVLATTYKWTPSLISRTWKVLSSEVKRPEGKARHSLLQLSLQTRNLWIFTLYAITAPCFGTETYSYCTKALSYTYVYQDLLLYFEFPPHPFSFDIKT